MTMNAAWSLIAVPALTLTLAISVPVPTALAPAVSDHDEACEGIGLPPHGIGEARTHEVIAGAVPNEFQPSCVALSSGDTVAWTNVGIVPHDPGDLGQSGECFSVTRDTLDGHGESQALHPGGRYEVTFTWDGGDTLTSESFLNGEPLASDVCDVGLLSDGAGPHGDLLEIPYICHRHHETTQGMLILHAG